MAPHSLIILLLLAINTNTSHGLNILDKLARIKDSLLGTQRQVSLSSQKFKSIKSFSTLIRNRMSQVSVSQGWSR